jgi:hypothetical protein
VVVVVVGESVPPLAFLPFTLLSFHPSFIFLSSVLSFLDRWSLRRPLVEETIRTVNADVVCLQEVLIGGGEQSLLGVGQDVICQRAMENGGTDTSILSSVCCLEYFMPTVPKMPSFLGNSSGLNPPYTSLSLVMASFVPCLLASFLTSFLLAFLTPSSLDNPSLPFLVIPPFLPSQYS